VSVNFVVGKTLVAYASEGGVNEDAAKIIADVLRANYGMDVTVADLKKESPDITPYQNVIVGSGVHMGHAYNEAVAFLGKDFAGKKVAIYLCCIEGGKPDSKRIEDYLKNLLSKNPELKPVEVGAFGGRMKMLWKVIDDRDMEKVKSWAIALGKKL